MFKWFLGNFNTQFCFHRVLFQVCGLGFFEGSVCSKG